MILSVTLLAILVACSFLVSGSETALFALSKQQCAAFAASTSRMKHQACALMKRPQRVLMTVVILNTAINIAVFAVSYVSFGALEESGPMTEVLAGLGALIAVLLFGEIIPKALALAHAERIAPLVAPLLHVLQIATLPLRVVLRYALVEPMTRLLSPSPTNESTIESSDLQALVELSAQQEIISTREHDMLQSVLALPEILVRSVMVPRVDVQAVPTAASMEQIADTFRRSGLKKLLVYGRDLDDVRGVLHARDVHLRPSAPASRLRRSVHFVPEAANLLQLMQHFRVTRSNFAVVVDEFGGVSGVVAVEDALEEIVGELESGDAPPQSQIERIDAHTWRVPGTLPIRPLKELLGVTGHFADVDSIGGVVLAILGRLPSAGDSVRVGGLHLTVDAMAGRRIRSILLSLTPGVAHEGLVP